MAKDVVLKIIMDANDKASKAFERVRKAADGVNSALFDTQKQLKQTDSAASHLKKLRDGIKNLTDTRQKLTQTVNEIKKLKGEMNAAGGGTEKQKRKFTELHQAAEKLRNKQQELAKSNQKLVEKFNEAGGALKKGALSAKSLAAAEADLKQKSDALTATMKKQETAVLRLGNARNQLNAAGRFAAGATMFSMLTQTRAQQMGAIMSAPIKAYAESETAGIDLQNAMMTTGGKVSAEYREINDLATRLGDKLPGTTADFKNLMTMLIRQGMSAKTILGGTGEAAALLAVQLKKTPEAAAEMAAKLQDAVRGSESEMLNIMDGIQRLFYAGVDDSNALGAFSKLSPALDVMKIKGTQAMNALGPLIGMLDQAGLVGDSAGNALRKVFTRMMDTQKINKTTKGSGISLDFTNGAGEFGGMDKMYSELAKLKSLNTESRLKILQGIFGDDAETLQALNTMIDKGKEGYEEFAQKMANQASLNERVNAQLGTLQNLWDAATGTFTNFLVSMGEAIAPELKSIVQWIGNVNEKLSIWAKNNPELVNWIMKFGAVLTIVLAGIAVLSGVLGSVVLALAAMKFSWIYLLSSLQGGVGLIGKVALAFKGGMMMVARAMLMNPIALMVAAAVAALYLLWRNWDAVKNAVSAGWQYLKTILRDNPFIGFLAGPIGLIASLIANFDRLKAKAIEVKNAIANSTIGRAVSAGWNAVTGGSPRGFSRGGYTGSGGVNEAAGIVHKGEVVFSQRDIARFGGWQTVERLRRGGIQALAGIRGFGSSLIERGRNALAKADLGGGAPILAGAVPVPQGFNRSGGQISYTGGTQNITININGGNLSPQEIAQEVQRQLKQAAAAAGRRARSSFYDKD